MGPLSGKRALACGGSQGIGKACAFEFARLGAQVTLLARDEETLRRVRNELDAARGGPAGHDYLRGDFGEPESVRAVVARHVERTGPVEILLNNTGGPPAGPLVEAEPATFLSAFSAHPICNQILAQTPLPGIKRAGHRPVIKILSHFVGQPNQ